jgi:gliding motility-associated lipoprotein GldD
VQEFANPDNQVWGLFCELHGNTATPMQFVLTDSTKHFFRGSVYCNCIPNQDSLAPIYDYLKQDVRIIMESLEWR